MAGDLESSAKPGRARETILIVEDEPLMLRLLEKFFARRGYEVLAQPSTASRQSKFIKIAAGKSTLCCWISDFPKARVKESFNA